MREKFNPKDIKFIISCLLIGALSTFFALSYFRQAFPEASINLKISKEEGREQAEQFLANREWDIADHIHGSRFGYHQNDKTILERHFDAEIAGQLYNDNVGYYWEYRWFKPGQKEEFKVELRTTGEIHLFDHVIADSTHGDSLNRDIAYEKARFYIMGTLGYDPEKWELMKETGTDRPNRYDHYFEWEEKDFYQKNGLEKKEDSDPSGNLEESIASHRISIDIRGSEVSKFHEWIKHPETWKREYKYLRSHNRLLNDIGGFFIQITLFIILMVIIIRTRKKDIRWKTAFSYGIIIAILMALNTLNRFPETLVWVPSSQSLFTLIFSKIFLDILLVSCIQGLFICIIIAGAEVYYRDQYPDQVAFRNILSVSGLKTKYFFNSAVLGLSLTALFFAYQTLFYIISNHFGGWSPTEVKNINALGTYIPWVGVLLWGLVPAVSEEGISRLFSIPFLQKHTKSTLAAVFLSSLFWGLAHAGYPAQPFYIRAIEVGVGGIFISIIFLRFGILPALIWHFTIDAVYGATILLRSDDAYMFTSGLLCSGVFFLPLTYSLISYFKNGGFVSSDPLVNALDTEIPTEVQKIVEEQDDARIKEKYKPLSSKRKKMGIIISSISILLTLFISKEDVLDELSFVNITQDEAYINAVDFLNSHTIDLNDYSYVITKENDILGWNSSVTTGWSYIGGQNLKVPQYIIEQADKDSSINAFEIINKAYTQHDAPHQWNVRFYKPGEIREYQVDIDIRSGDVGEYEQTLADTTYLPSISADSALIIAKNELTEKWGFKHNFYKLKEIASEEKENRTDHNITFQSEEFVGKARYLYFVTIQGNMIGSVYKYFWLPEEWEREFEKPTPLSNIKVFYSTIIILIVLIMIFVTVLKLLKTNEIPWKYISFGGLAFVFVQLIDYINDSATFMSSYDTGRLITQHIVSEILGSYAMGIVFNGIMCTILILAIYMMWPGIFSSFLKKNRQPYLADALTASFVAAGFVALVGLFENQMSAIFTNWIPFHSLDISINETFYPGLDQLVKVLSGAPFWAMVVISVYYLHRRYFAEKGIILSNLMVLLLTIFFAIGEPGQKVLMYLPEFLVGGFWFICLLILFKYFCQWNPWSYLFAVGFMWYGVDIIRYMQLYTHPYYQLQGWIVISIGILFFAYLAWQAFGSSSQEKHAISS